MTARSDERACLEVYKQAGRELVEAIETRGDPMMARARLRIAAEAWVRAERRAAAEASGG